MRRNLIVGVLLIVFLAAALWLAGFSEAYSFQTGCINCTLGLIVADRLVPLQGLAKFLEVAVTVDAPIWFLLICATAFAIRRYSHGKKLTSVDSSLKGVSKEK